MSMLGAQLEDLDLLAQQFDNSTGRLDDVNGSCLRIQQTVSDQLRQAFGQAIAEVQVAMGDLASIVTDAQARLDSTVWTGANRSAFDDAASGFGTAMHGLESAIDETWAHFNGEAERIAGFLTEFQTELTGHMAEAQESTQSMREAVQMQRDNLDAAMNGVAV